MELLGWGQYMPRSFPRYGKKIVFLQCICERLNKGGTADFRPLHNCYAEGFLLYKNRKDTVVITV